MRSEFTKIAMYKEQFSVGDRVVVQTTIYPKNGLYIISAGDMGIVQSYHPLADCYRVLFDVNCVESRKNRSRYVAAWHLKYDPRNLRECTSQSPDLFRENE